MKADNTQILKKMKSSYFCKINSNDDNCQGAFSKTNDKLNKLEFELERHRDTIIHLRAEIANKDKEISLLKVNKNKKKR